MLDFEATIPESLRCYLPINNVFTDVLTKRFGELVNPGKQSIDVVCLEIEVF